MKYKSVACGIMLCIIMGFSAYATVLQSPGKPAPIKKIAPVYREAIRGTPPLLFQYVKNALSNKFLTLTDTELVQKTFEYIASSNALLSEMNRYGDIKFKADCLGILQAGATSRAFGPGYIECIEKPVSDFTDDEKAVLATLISTEDELKSIILGMPLGEVRSLKVPINEDLMKYLSDEFAMRTWGDIYGGEGESSKGSGYTPTQTTTKSSGSAHCLFSKASSGGGGVLSGGPGGGATDPTSMRDPLKDFTQEKETQKAAAGSTGGYGSANKCQKGGFGGVIDRSKVPGGQVSKSPKEWNRGQVEREYTDEKGREVTYKVEIRVTIVEDNIFSPDRYEVQVIREKSIYDRRNGDTTHNSRDTFMVEGESAVEEVYRREQRRADEDMNDNMDPNKDSSAKDKAPGASGSNMPADESSGASECLSAAFAGCGFGTAGGGAPATCTGLSGFKGGKVASVSPDPEAAFNCGSNSGMGLDPSKYRKYWYDPPRDMIGVQDMNWMKGTKPFRK